MASPAESLPSPSLAPHDDAPADPTPHIQRARKRARRDADGVWSRQEKISLTIYWGIHAACLLALYTGASVTDVALCLGLFWLRMFGITGAYHRYFSHRGYRTSRPFQFVLALLGCLAVQKGPLWWASGHRHHHRFSDQDEDMHSPRHGFWWSHQGWIFDGRFDDTNLQRISDFAKYPELMWLNRWHVVPPALLALGLFLFGGLSALVWGFAISTTLLWHSTYTINSLSHVFGKRRYETGDDSRNNVWLALLTLGEGWHNNHHYYQASARNGFYWWEIDITYYLLKGLEKVGLVWDLRQPPQKVLDEGRRA
ncbi:MAG: acyl-CoA desaturase [Myxococcota bacterium]